MVAARVHHELGLVIRQPAVRSLHFVGTRPTSIGAEDEAAGCACPARAWRGIVVAVRRR